MRIRDDGSIQSAATPTHQNVGGREDFALYRCMVKDVIYVDDPKNIGASGSNPRVMYNVVIIGGWKSGQIVSNCRLSSDLGGNYNYHERILKAASKSISKTPLSQNDGDIVLVQFIQGDPGFPMIVGLDQGINTGTAVGAKSTDKMLDREQYNGISRLIDKSGNFTWARYGGSFDSTGAFVPNASPDVNLQVATGKVTLTMQSGTTVTIDGTNDDVKVQTKGGASLDLNGKTGTITVKDNGTGSLKISGSKVALGASSAELLQQIVDMLDKIITLAGTESSHMHLGNLGFPTGPTTAAGAWSGLASDLGTIKGLVSGIKGTL